jgi:TolB protein
MSHDHQPRFPRWAFLALAVLGVFVAYLPGGGQKPGTILFVSLDPAKKLTRVGVMNPDGSGRKFLTAGAEQELDPVWSRDRSRIAFIVANTKQKSGDLFVMNADGSGRKRLTQSPPRTVVHAPSWSPDGKRIAFTQRTFDATGKPSAPELFVIDADGKGQERLGNVPGMLPAWSPDGSKILFALPDLKKPLDTGLAVMTPDGKNVRPFVAGRGIMGAWSPDGRRVAFMGMDGDKRAFYVANADGSGRQVIRHATLAMEVGPEWSPDGKRLYFTGAGIGKKLSIAIYAMDADGRNVHRVSDPNEVDFLGGGAGIFIPVATEIHGGGPKESVGRKNQPSER